MFSIIKPKRLCLSGGGIRTVSYIGALQVLETKGLLEELEEFLGVSAGAFIAFLLVIGYSLTELEKIMCTIDFGEIRSIDDPANFLFYADNFGLDDGAGLITLIESLLKKKGLPIDLTFSALSSKKRLRIFATDLNELKKREFSAKLTPNVRIIDALRASMALPLYFTPIKDPITGNLLADGALIANYPIIHLNSFESRDTIGLTFDDHKNNHSEITSLMIYFHQIMSCYWVNKNNAIYSHYAKNTIIIPCAAFPSLNFELTEKDKKFLYDSGANAAKQYLEMLKSPQKPFRRRSVS